MKVSEWRAELWVDKREWRDDKPTKKGISLTLMRWKNWVSQLEFLEKDLHEKMHQWQSHRRKTCTVLSPKTTCVWI